MSIIGNRPGLPAISYRTGTYATFLRDMLARLPAQSIPGKGRPLAALTTRAPDDPTIALLDAWAMVADVLTFYQERIANEGFLRTATERASVLELARAIGYELRPGVAASTFLSFTVDDAPGSPTVAFVPQWTKIQSLPTHGGMPQTFETITSFTAHSGWNVLRPQLMAPQVLDDVTSTVNLEGSDHNLQQGDFVLLVQTVENDGTGQPSTRLQTRRVVRAQVDQRRQLTSVDLDQPRQPPAPTGYVPPQSGLATPTAASVPLDDATVDGIMAGHWTEEALAAMVAIQGWQPDALLAAVRARRVGALVGTDLSRVTTTVPVQISGTVTNGVFDGSLVATVPVPQTNLLVRLGGTISGDISGPVSGSLGGSINPDPKGAPSNSIGGYLVLKLPGSPVRGLSAAFTGTFSPASPPAGTTTTTLTATVNGSIETAPPGAPPPDQPGLYRFTARAGIFGSSAPLWASLPPALQAGHPDWEGTTIERDGKWALRPLGHFLLERVVEEVKPGGWVVLEDPVSATGFPENSPYRVDRTQEYSVADFALVGRVTDVKVRTIRDISVEGLSFEWLHMRSTTVHAGSTLLPLTGLPIEAPFGQGTSEARQLTLDTMVLGLGKGQPVIVTGERSDLSGTAATEVAVINQVIHHAGVTTLFFEADLQYSYLRQKAMLMANVVPATHGETTRQVLGSGDATRANQRFTLNKPPLTYVSAPTATGAASTLEVRVGGLRWDEAPALYGLDHRSSSYVIRADHDGRANVIFGDGVEGARLPGGTENVTAVYRSGLGLAGQVGADSLTLLQTRPPGIRGVTNPVPATGAAEPEQLSDARANAPRTVLTLDRIVSSRDFEDFAQGFAGIGKAQAVALQSAEARIVHLTVAGADGSVIDVTAKLYRSLVTAIAGSADPVQRFQVAAHVPRAFNLAAAVVVDARYETDVVLAAVRAALFRAFSFGQRSFGQPASSAEVISVIQAVPGVVASDLTRFYRVDDPAGATRATPDPIVAAQRARLEDDLVLPAELLLLSPAGLELTEMLP